MGIVAYGVDTVIKLSGSGFKLQNKQGGGVFTQNQMSFDSLVASFQIDPITKWVILWVFLPFLAMWHSA